MGADLITVGFTTCEPGINAKAAQDMIDSLPDDKILSIIDWLGDQASDGRDVLKAGAQAAEDIRNGMRDGEIWNIGDDRLFYVAGGTSYGDDPFEGFSSLSAFIYACSQCAPLARAANFLGPGIVPSTSQAPELDITVTPELLREIADDLEREGPDYCRTIISKEGVLISLATLKESE